MKSKIQNEGRLYYIDPNNIYNNIENGIPHPYEDYCISVDLSIQFSDRDSCGIWGNMGRPSTNPEYTFQSDRGTINFIGGTNGYLTTNYTDIQSVNPQENTNECLGIESINIAYTSWYVPEVKIRFVDVRGASLMGPQEQGYVETIRYEEYTGHKGDTSIIDGSFFKALFSFPYPLFKLKVKGFYGREVTYNLSVEDFQGNFNAENGNYEIDVKFIGYMYGIYTDIPMNYLMIAPFFDDGSGKGYWDAQKSNGRFLYYGGLPFYNYVELRRELNDVAKNSIPPTTDGEKQLYDRKIMLDNRLAALRKIQEDIHSFLKNIFDVGYCYAKLIMADGSGAIHYTICGISTKYKSIDFVETSPKRKERGTYYANNDYQALVRSVLEYNEKYPDSTLSDLNYFGLRNLGGSNSLLKEIQAGKASEISITESYLEVNTENRDETVKKWCINRIKDEIDGGNIVNSTTLYVYEPWLVGEFVNETIPENIALLNKKIELARKDLEAVELEIQGRSHENVSRALGFGTSIGNAFNMAFAHMETFINIFNEYLHKIHLMKGNGKRSLKTLGSTVADTDLSANFSLDRNVPPFTMFYKEIENDNSGNSGINTRSGKKRVAMWPGKLPGNTNALVEIDFVNRLIDAAKLFGSSMRDIEAAMEEARDMTDRREQIESQVYVPTTLYDLAHIKSENPYSYIGKVSGGNKQWELMLITFVLRYVYWYSASNTDSFKNSETVNRAFGEIEAYNVFRAFPDILPAIREWLISDWGSDFERVVHYIGDYKNEYDERRAYDLGREYSNDFIFNESNNVLRYCWLYLNDNGTNRYVYPIGKINPAMANPYIARVTNEDYIFLLEDGEQPNTVFATQYQPIGDASKAYIDFHVDSIRYVDNIEKLGSDTKNAYRKQILPNVTLNTYEIDHYAIKTSNIGTGSFSQTLPESKSNGKNYYVYSPSFIFDGIYSCPTYGHPLFYAQNRHNTYEERMLAKAYLFLTGVPIKYTNYNYGVTTKVGEDNIVMPYLMALAYGARLYRNEVNTGTTERFLCVPENTDILFSPDIDYYYKCSNYTFYGQYNTVFTIARGTSDTSKFQPSSTIENLKDFSESAKSSLKKMFKDWALSEFANEINTLLELKGQYTESYDSFVKCVKKVSEANNDKRKPKEPIMSALFNEGGSFNMEFYDKDGVVTTIGNGLKLPTIHVSEAQQKLIDLFNRQVVIIDTAKLRNKEMSIRIKDFRDGYYGFLHKLKDIYETQLNGNTKLVDTENGPVYDPARDEDLKLSTYMTLKNIYDRWLCMNCEPNRWKLDGGEASEFSQFKYIDGFYRDLKTRIAVNFEHINELASQMLASSNVTNDATSTKYMGRSFYDFLSAICQKNQMVMLALPMENEFNRPEGIVELFDVKSYSNMEIRDTSCYVCLYSNEPSRHLDIQYDTDEYMYATDGFNIANANGLIVSDLIPQIKDVDIDGYKIPAFGVTYAKQNQSIFNKITVNMQNPQVTEASIAATQLIASKNNEGGHQTALYGQDLYRIYANYSYTCTVEMLGNAQIMPLMYFQLNNIPLFRGAYMIINIEHSISAGRMTTKFTGVRMSRFDTPLVSDMGLFTDPFIPNTVYSRGEGSNVEILATGYDNINFTKETYALFLNDNMPTKYSVTMQDLVYSDKATANNIPNNPAPGSKELANLEGLMALLNELEDAWTWYCSQHRNEKWAEYDGIFITSGYRCEELNRSVGSKPGGPHTHGNAADMHVCKYDTTKRNTTTNKANYHNGLPVISHDYSCPVFFEFVIKFMAASGRGWGQIIDERKGNSKWVHLGYQTADGGTAKKEILQYRNGDYFKLKME